MNIQSINLHFSTNKVSFGNNKIKAAACAGTTLAAGMAACAGTTLAAGMAACADMFSDIYTDKKTRSVYEFQNAKFDEEEDIFDAQFYADYYNIDLNLAKSRAFRDNELFNPLRDDERCNYAGYDNDDLPLAENLLTKNVHENSSEYKTMETDIEYDDVFIRSLNPYQEDDFLKEIEKKWEQFYGRFFEDKNIDTKVKHDIIENCTFCDRHGDKELMPEFVHVAELIYKNGNKFGKIEKDIISDLLIYNRSRKEMDENRLEIVLDGLRRHLSNKSIKQNLRLYWLMNR